MSHGYLLFLVRQALRCWRPRRTRTSYGVPGAPPLVFERTQWLFWVWVRRVEP